MEADQTSDVAAVRESDSLLAHLLWVMSLGLLAFLAIAGLTMSLG